MPKGVKGVFEYTYRVMVRKLLDKEKKFSCNDIYGGNQLTSEEKSILYKARSDESVDPNTKKKRWHMINSSRAVPGHVQASINWNNRLDALGDRKTLRISDGMKIRVYYLKEPNELGFSNIAIPTDIPEYPDWFLGLPFDRKKMVDVLVNKKINTLYSTLNWKVPKEGSYLMETFFEF
jgi:hypothetical protein